MKEIKLAIFPKDGEPVYYYIDENDTFHAYYLELFMNENFKDADVDRKNANSMTLFLRDHGYAVFLNTTTYKESIFRTHGRSGIIVIPDYINDNQEKELLELNDKIQNYDFLQVWHEFSSLTECKMTSRLTNEESKTLIPGFLEYYKGIQNAGKSK